MAAAAAALSLTVLAPLVLVSLNLPVAEGRIIDWVHGEQGRETALETRPGRRRGKHNADKKGEAEEGRARTEGRRRRRRREKNVLMGTNCDGEEARGDGAG